MPAEAWVVLVTGSRNWDDQAAVWDALDAQLAEHPLLLLVHGDCREGADAMARSWYLARLRGGLFEAAMPAKWRRHGRGAGYVRNMAMVNAGADVCLAFIAECVKKTCPYQGRHGSHGTLHCAGEAEARGIPVLKDERF